MMNLIDCSGQLWKELEESIVDDTLEVYYDEVDDTYMVACDKEY